VERMWEKTKLLVVGCGWLCAIAVTLMECAGHAPPRPGEIASVQANEERDGV
jgi:hypothetical protein